MCMVTCKRVFVDEIPSTVFLKPQAFLHIFSHTDPIK